MDYRKTYLPSSHKRKQFLMENGSALQEKLIATFGARYKLPIRCFAAKEISKVTNNFTELVASDIYLGALDVHMINGLFGQRPVLVAKQFFYERLRDPCYLDQYQFDSLICNVVFGSQMSHLKNVLKLVGCCLEFEYPVLVYEDVGWKLLDCYLYQPENARLLSWKSRIRIAKEIAYTLSYFHTAFSTPIIYGNLCSSNVIIDRLGIPKLFDFSNSKILPPGEIQAKMDKFAGIYGFLGPEYMKSGYITPKADVYSFGILLLKLITRRKSVNQSACQPTLITEDVNGYLAKNQLNQIVDHKLWESEEKEGKLQQLQALVELGLRCAHVKGENWPEMIDVAKEICRIEKIIV